MKRPLHAFWPLILILGIGCLKPSNPIKVVSNADLGAARKIAVLDFGFQPSPRAAQSATAAIRTIYKYPKEEEKPGSVMADAMAAALMKGRLYEVVDRAKVANLQQPATAMPTAAQLAPLAKELSVDGFVAGTVTECVMTNRSACCASMDVTEIRADVRLVTAAGDEVWSTSMYLREDGVNWNSAMRRLANRVAKALDQRLPRR